MKKILILILLLIPMKTKAVDTSANSAILMDMDSKRILYAKNINDVKSVASISKIMTAIVAIEKKDLNTKVIVGNEIEKAYGSSIYIKTGEKLTLRDLLYGLMLRSGNDAALSIAKTVSKDTNKFVDEMNKEAKKIGMKNTIFKNPHGLDEEDGGNLSTAKDMAILTSYAMKNKEYKKIVKTQKYSLKTNKNTYIWYNKNKMLKNYKYITGGKTGFTKKARRTLVSTASKDELNLVVVTLNDGNDFSDHKKLYEYIYENYKKYRILKKGNLNIKDKFYKKYKIYLKNNYDYPLSIDEEDSIKIKYNLNKKRKIKNDMKVGTADIYLGEELIHKENIWVRK